MLDAGVYWLGIGGFFLVSQLAMPAWCGERHRRAMAKKAAKRDTGECRCPGGDRHANLAVVAGAKR